MDSQALGIVATIIINSVAIAWTIRETFVRHGQTKELQESNARLQSEVNRLSVYLDQEIVRLNRIIELTREVYISSARLGHKLAISVDDTIDASVNLSIQEVADFILTVDVSTIEIQAIANVIGDSDLQKLAGAMSRTARTLNASRPESNAEWFERVREYGKLVTDVQERVYRLLQEVTKST